MSLGLNLVRKIFCEMQACQTISCLLLSILINKVFISIKFHGSYGGPNKVGLIIKQALLCKNMYAEDQNILLT